MRNAYLSNTVSPLNVNRQMHSGSIGIDTHDDKSLPGYDYINTGDINPQFMVYVNGSCAGLYYWSSRESQSADNGWRNVQLHNGDSVKMVRVAMPLFNKEDSSGLDSSVWNLLNASEEHYQSSVALIDMTAPGSAKVGDKATFSATVTGANTTNLGSGKSAAGITLFISAPSEAETLGQPIYKSAAVTGEDGSLQYVFTQPGWYTVAMFNVTPDKLTFTSVYIPAAAGMATCGISAPEWSKRSRADRSLVARLWIITSLDDPCACRMVGQDTLSSCPGTVQQKCTLARKIVETRRCVIFPTNGNTAR